VAPAPFGTALDSASDQGLVNIGSALHDGTICQDTGSGPDKNDVANAQLREWNSLGVRARYAFSGVREQRGECIERTASLGNGPHFQPVAEDHDRNQRRGFPPNVDFEKAECRSERSSKSDYDRQADECHHAGLVVGKFAPCPADKNNRTPGPTSNSQLQSETTSGRSSVAERELPKLRT
jgi:hypothetical protein